MELLPAQLSRRGVRDLSRDTSSRARASTRLSASDLSLRDSRRGSRPRLSSSSSRTALLGAWGSALRLGLGEGSGDRGGGERLELPLAVPLSPMAESSEASPLKCNRQEKKNDCEISMAVSLQSYNYPV